MQLTVEWNTRQIVGWTGNGLLLNFVACVNGGFVWDAIVQIFIWSALIRCKTGMGIEESEISNCYWSAEWWLSSSNLEIPRKFQVPQVFHIRHEWIKGFDQWFRLVVGEDFNVAICWNWANFLLCFCKMHKFLLILFQSFENQGKSWLNRLLMNSHCVFLWIFKHVFFSRPSQHSRMKRKTSF